MPNSGGRVAGSGKDVDKLFAFASVSSSLNKCSQTAGSAPGSFKREYTSRMTSSGVMIPWEYNDLSVDISRDPSHFCGRADTICPQNSSKGFNIEAESHTYPNRPFKPIGQRWRFTVSGKSLTSENVTISSATDLNCF